MNSVSSDIDHEKYYKKPNFWTRQVAVSRIVTSLGEILWVLERIAFEHFTQLVIRFYIATYETTW